MDMNTKTTPNTMNTMKSTDTEMNWCKEMMSTMHTCMTQCRSYSEQSRSMGWKFMFTTMACCLQGCTTGMQTCMDMATRNHQ